jgi:hypothetical protein
LVAAVLAVGLLGGGGFLWLRHATAGPAAPPPSPVAVLRTGGMETAVAGDGVALGSRLISPSLPRLPATVVPMRGRRVRNPQLLRYLTLLGAAPRPLLPYVSKLYVGAQGLTARLRGGLTVYFGDTSRPHAKWDSLITVLLQGSSKGASYIDVRLPERPAAGGFSGSESEAPSGEGASEAAQVSASDPTSAALAASLAAAVNGTSAAPATSAPAQAEPTKTTEVTGTTATGAEATGAGASTGETPTAGAPATETTAGEPSSATGG